VGTHYINMTERIVNNYKLSEVIGKGSFGKVFMGTCIPSSTKYAIKAIKIESLDHMYIERVIDEIHHLHLMQSERYITKIIESFQEGSYLYIVMEYCPGGDLSRFLSARKNTNSSPIQISIVKKWFEHLIQGYQSLLSRNIIHRDIKPHNILLTSSDIETNELRIADFGLSKSLEDLKISMSKVGTTPYMSPEMLSVENYNYKSDIYSLGLVFYEILTLTYPFHQERGYEAVRHKELQKQGILNWGNIPEIIQDLIRGMTQYDIHTRLDIDSIINHPFFTNSHTPDYLSPYTSTQVLSELENSAMFAKKLYNTGIDMMREGDKKIYIGFMHLEVALNVINCAIWNFEQDGRVAYSNELTQLVGYLYKFRDDLGSYIGNLLNEYDREFMKNCINYVNISIYTLMSNRQFGEAYRLAEIARRWKAEQIISDIIKYYDYLDRGIKDGTFKI
jgi:serine/threonine protein kinase